MNQCSPSPRPLSFFVKTGPPLRFVSFSRLQHPRAPLRSNQESYSPFADTSKEKELRFGDCPLFHFFFSCTPCGHPGSPPPPSFDIFPLRGSMRSSEVRLADLVRRSPPPKQLVLTFLAAEPPCRDHSGPRLALLDGQEFLGPLSSREIGVSINSENFRAFFL